MSSVEKRTLNAFAYLFFEESDSLDFLPHEQSAEEGYSYPKKIPIEMYEIANMIRELLKRETFEQSQGNQNLGYGIGY